DLEPVFKAMLERAIRLCEANFGALYRFDGNAFHLAAQVGASRELADFDSRRGPFQPTPGGLLDRVMRTKKVNFVADITTEPSGPATKLGNARSVNAAIGTVSNVASRLCDEAKPGQILISP